MALPLSNTFETGLSDETAITTGNSNSGSAGDAWDAISFGTGSGVYDTLRFAHGALSARLTTASPAAACYVQWSTALGTLTECWGRVYLWVAAAPAGNMYLVQFEDATERCALVYLGNDANLYVFNHNLAASQNAGITISYGQWLRFEWHLLSSATVGIIEAKVFAADALAPLGTATFTNTDTKANFTSIKIGDCAANNASLSFWLDDITVNATGYPGPLYAPNLGLTETHRLRW